ncbi:MAG: hypothetical protein ACE5HJ_05075 [Thermoplasmata archaeon]
MTEHLLLSAIKGLAVFLGTVISLFGYVAFRRYGSKLMLYISVGFALITLGTVTEGILFEFVRTPLDVAHFVESSIVLVGLLVLAYHLRPTKRGRLK